MGVCAQCPFFFPEHPQLDYVEMMHSSPTVCTRRFHVSRIHYVPPQYEIMTKGLCLSLLCHLAKRETLLMRAVGHNGGMQRHSQELSRNKAICFTGAVLGIPASQRTVIFPLINGGVHYKR